ncbi:type I restriction-modification system subunit M [Campylobacter lanienae]|uniref:type I restriction-modification system subunit M n=1 Tax=Campylobacter lanienae TaxID=75658 RepID=UPI003AFAA414
MYNTNQKTLSKSNLKAIKMASNHQREELHKAIWSIADDLRGSVDGWDFKQYVLGIMFYRYISENIANYINEGERAAGDTTFDYANLEDSEAEFERDNLVTEKGFFIRPSELFCNVIKSAKSDSATFTDSEGKTKNIKDNLNEYLEMIFNNIENSAKGTQSEDDFSGLFDDIDVNSNKLGATVAKRNEKLLKILDGIAGINLGNYKDNDIDAFGDAYEFLMSMYASNAGKSGGEFYTPQEVSELLTKLAILDKKEVNKVYDPACGSGSLLLKSAKILGKENVRNGFYGQEINLTTYNLCRINMFLHDIGYDKFNIACEDTLTMPKHWDDEPFEVIVSNPPYSIKWAGDDNAILINDERYSPAGVLAPKSKADFAFIMHSLSWLAPNGTASIVCFPGILYRGGAEQKIRRYLIDNNFIDSIIQLPDNLFFGTSIATCIMVLKKGKKDNSTLFINASKECVKVTNNNRLTDKNIDNIVKIFKDRKDINHIAKLIPNKEIAQNNYNLSVSTYVEQEDTREKIDIVKLNNEIAQIVARENELRKEIDKIILEIEA